jgi:hypothetical protein
MRAHYNARSVRIWESTASSAHKTVSNGVGYATPSLSKTGMLCWYNLLTYDRANIRNYTSVRILSPISSPQVSFLRSIQRRGTSTHFPHTPSRAPCDQCILCQKSASYLNRYRTQNGHSRAYQTTHMSRETILRFWTRKVLRPCARSVGCQEKFWTSLRLPSSPV